MFITKKDLQLKKKEQAIALMLKMQAEDGVVDVKQVAQEIGLSDISVYKYLREINNKDSNEKEEDCR